MTEHVLGMLVPSALGEIEGVLKRAKFQKHSVREVTVPG